MSCFENEIGRAVARKIIAQSQSAKIITFCKELRIEKYSKYIRIFGFISFFGIFGAFGASIAEAFGAKGLLVVSILYTLILFFFAWFLTAKRGKRLAGGISALGAVCIFPVIIFSLEQILGIWPTGGDDYQSFHFWAYGNWLMIELTTIGVGLIVLALVRYSFILIPMLLAMWHFSMDLSALVFSQMSAESSAVRYGSIIWGFLLLAAAYLLDRRIKEDYSFWGYLFGLCAVIGGVSSLGMTSPVQIIVFMIIILLVFFAAFFLERRLFFIAGELILLGCVPVVLNALFKESTVGVFCFIAIASLEICALLMYIRSESALYKKFEQKLPKAVAGLKPYKRAYGFFSRR